MGDYDVAQICENGHVANSMARDNPARNQDHCDKCGSPTIMACPSCQTKIRGFYSVPGVFGIFDKYAAPAFCYKCGKPFPWTAVGLRAAKDLVVPVKQTVTYRASFGHVELFQEYRKPLRSK